MFSYVWSKIKLFINKQLHLDFCVSATLYCYNCSLTGGKLFCPDDGIAACEEGQVDIQITYMMPTGTSGLLENTRERFDQSQEAIKEARF